jgi:hypothetical protein
MASPLKMPRMPLPGPGDNPFEFIVRMAPIFRAQRQAALDRRAALAFEARLAARHAAEP